MPRGPCARRLHIQRGLRRELKELVWRGRDSHLIVQRARIVLLAHEGRGTDEIARTVGWTSRAVRKWKARFEGAPALDTLNDADRSGRPSRTPQSQRRPLWRMPAKVVRSPPCLAPTPPVPGRGYDRHRPEETVLFETVQGHWRTFLADLSAAEEPCALPGFVLAEVEAYLRCGVLAHGLLLTRCRDCGNTRPVAFCQRRGFCPSCRPPDVRFRGPRGRPGVPAGAHRGNEARYLLLPPRILMSMGRQYLLPHVRNPIGLAIAGLPGLGSDLAYVAHLESVLGMAPDPKWRPDQRRLHLQLQSLVALQEKSDPRMAGHRQQQGTSRLWVPVLRGEAGFPGTEPLCRQPRVGQTVARDQERRLGTRRRSARDHQVCLVAMSEKPASRLAGTRLQPKPRFGVPVLLWSEGHTRPVAIRPDSPGCAAVASNQEWRPETTGRQAGRCKDRLVALSQGA